MPLDDLDRRLASLDDSFKLAKADSFGGNWLPDPGTYQGILREVDFFEKKDPPNNAFLKLTWELTQTGAHDAEYAGLTVERIYNLEPHLVTGVMPASTEEVQQKLGFLKKDLRTLGVNVEAADFSFALVRPGSPIWDDVLNCPYELAVVDSKRLNPETNKPYRNLYLNDRLGPALTSDVPTDIPQQQVPLMNAAASVDKDEIPF